MTIQRIVRVCFAFLLIGTLAGTSMVSATTAPTNPDDDFYVYIPTNAAARGPLQVLVTVHGMGGDGTSFCQNLISRAEQEGWIIVSPTYHYLDNYERRLPCARTTSKLMPHLKQYLDNLPAKTGLPIRDKVLLYGFSRGAQIVHRFAEFYPDKTLAVALFAAGSYTLPVPTMSMDGTPTHAQLPVRGGGSPEVRGHAVRCSAHSGRFPSSSVSVARIDPTGYAPPAWNPYIGTTRLARAQSIRARFDGLWHRRLVDRLPGHRARHHDATCAARRWASSTGKHSPPRW